MKLLKSLCIGLSLCLVVACGDSDSAEPNNQSNNTGTDTTDDTVATPEGFDAGQAAMSTTGEPSTPSTMTCGFRAHLPFRLSRTTMRPGPSSRKMIPQMSTIRIYGAVSIGRPSTVSCGIVRLHTQLKPKRRQSQRLRQTRPHQLRLAVVVSAGPN